MSTTLAPDREAATVVERAQVPESLPVAQRDGDGPAPLKVLCVSNMWPGEGDPDFGSFVRDMCDALEGEDCEVDTAVIDRRGGGALRSVRKYLRLLADAVLQARGADVIYAHYLFPTGAIAALAGRLSGTPVVLTAHGQDVANLRRRPLRTASAPGVRRAAAVIAVSGYLAERLRESGLRPARLEVIDMGVDMAAFTPGDRAQARARLGIAGDGPLVLAVGSEETDEFLRQQAEYASAWQGRGLAAREVDMTGLNHFSAVDA
ncbi:MAG: glycosyltransferase, partial [Miltoncostaeaceae bacterium]